MPSAAKKAPAPDIRRDMEKEIAAAQALKFQLTAIYGDGEPDTVLLRDMVEGETDLIETVDGILQQIQMDQSHIVGIEKSMADTASRKQRLEKRVDTMRTMLASALEILEQKKFDRPLATVTLKPTARKVLVTDEAAIPTKFWKQPAPELSKKDLGEALKARDVVLDRLAEFERDLKAGKIAADQADEQRHHIKSVLDAMPPIPGAELDNGSVTVQIRFS